MDTCAAPLAASFKRLSMPHFQNMSRRCVMLELVAVRSFRHLTAGPLSCHMSWNSCIVFRTPANATWCAPDLVTLQADNNMAAVQQLCQQHDRELTCKASGMHGVEARHQHTALLCCQGWKELKQKCAWELPTVHHARQSSPNEDVNKFTCIRPTRP